MMMKQHPSIYDVAREAGVSISTVSRVLNRLDRVAPDTRESVEKAIKRLGFRPNIRGRALSRRRTDTIGLIVPGFRGDYFGRLMEGVDAEAHESGMQMMVVKANGREAKVESTQKLLNEGRVDGLILMVDEMSRGVFPDLEHVKSPVVVLDEDVGHRHLDNVLVDNITGGRDATQHLIETHGIRDLVFLGGPEDNIDSRDRARGFSDALAAAGIEDQPEMYLSAPYDFGAGFERVQEIIPRFSGGPRWGLVAANDDLALGAMAAIQRAALHIPDDVAVVGYDDSHLARFGSPQLSSVRVPLKEVGRTAVRMILEWLRDERREPTTVILKPRLIARQSCGCDPELIPVLSGAAEDEERSQ